MKIKVILSIAVIALLWSCKSNSDNDKVSVEAAEKWLYAIFQCPNGNGFCFPEWGGDDKLYTKRFLEFYNEAIELYSFWAEDNYDSEEALEQARAQYKKKWASVYNPVKEDDLNVFGTGNGDVDKLEDLKIKHLKDLSFNVFIDYGEVKTSSDVILVKNGDSFQIDYMNTNFID